MPARAAIPVMPPLSGGLGAMSQVLNWSNEARPARDRHVSVLASAPYLVQTASAIMNEITTPNPIAITIAPASLPGSMPAESAIFGRPFRWACALRANPVPPWRP